MTYWTMTPIGYWTMSRQLHDADSQLIQTLMILEPPHSDARSRWHLGLLATLFLLTACVTPQPLPDPVVQSGAETTPPEVDPFSPPEQVAGETAPSTPQPVKRPVSFDELPNWDSSLLTPAIKAFARSCERWENLPDDAPVSKRVSYAGHIGDWRPACAAMDVVLDPHSARHVFEALFTPLEVLANPDKTRFTGYFEPEIEARRTPVFPYTQPIPGLPDDLVQVPANQIGGQSTRNAPAQRLPDGSLRPYPPRADIVNHPENILGFAHPTDVFFLQIQGSGRLRYEDGSTLRAAYAAHNGQPFKSTANHLIQTGKITRGQASMQGIRAWMDSVSREEAQAAMNANPRFVFFRPIEVGDPTLGPVGAQSVPLTPLGSMAVDTDIHALGVPFFVQTSAPGLGGDWSGLLVSQDTGGAIKGRVRGDIYYGTGDEAGSRAGTQNAPGRMWAFLPRALAAELIGQHVDVSAVGD